MVSLPVLNCTELMINYILMFFKLFPLNSLLGHVLSDEAVDFFAVNKDY